MVQQDADVRLSSDYLYHFKRDPAVLELILQHGFRYNSWGETLPYLQSKPADFQQRSFVVCFCDLRPEEAAPHRECYGSNALVMHKEWGIRHGISPVRYVHANSPGATPDYAQLRSMYRSARKRSLANSGQMLMHYLVECAVQEAGHSVVQDDSRMFPLALPGADQVAQAVQRQLKQLQNDAEGKAAIDLMDMLMDRIHALHNELEHRDAFVRAYRENFECPATRREIKGKVLYDEREWRSVRFLTVSRLREAPQDLLDAESNKHLPSEDNLRFGGGDVHAVLAQDAATRERLAHLIKSGRTLLPATLADRVFVATAFREGT